jgi:nitroreductase
MTMNNNLQQLPFIDLVRHRTSCRSYRSKPVPRAHLELMIEAARLAPSACNLQPWRFAVAEDEAVRMQLVDKALRFGIEMKWAADAGVIIALGIERTGLVHKVGTKISGVEYPHLDLGIAGEHMVLQATELGLGTCWIGWIKQKAVRRIVGWPDSILPIGLLTVGWPASDERSTRPRKQRGDIVRWL